MFASVVRGITLCPWIPAGDVPTTFTNQPPIEFTKSLRLEIRSPGSRPQPPNMTHWQYQHPSICRSNRTTLADECTQGFPLCCRIRPDIAVFCIDRTATCPRGSTELALDTPPCPRDLSQSPVFIVAKASSDHHPSILVPQQVPCLTGPGGARSRS